MSGNEQAESKKLLILREQKEKDPARYTWWPTLAGGGHLSAGQENCDHLKGWGILGSKGRQRKSTDGQSGGDAPTIKLALACHRLLA